MKHITTIPLCAGMLPEQVPQSLGWHVTLKKRRSTDVVPPLILAREHQEEGSEDNIDNDYTGPVVVGEPADVSSHCDDVCSKLVAAACLA